VVSIGPPKRRMTASALASAVRCSAARFAWGDRPPWLPHTSCPAIAFLVHGWPARSLIGWPFGPVEM
jgi:hypothetical protein